MKIKLLLLALFVSAFSWGQVQLSEGTPTQVIDFSATVAGVSNGPFTAAGFQATPTAGQLDSDAWATTGFSDFTLNFGGTPITPGDHARGLTAVAQTTGGIYAHTGAPNSVPNPCLMIQPAGSDFTPGTLTLRIRNNGAGFINQIVASYNIFYRNDQASSNSLNFSYSTDDTSYTSVGSLDFATPVSASGTTWLLEGSTPSRATTITGLSIAPGDYFYIRWNSDDVVGGTRDELGLDDISVTASFGAPSAPVITSDLTASGFLGVPYSYSIVATNSPTSYNATGLPAGFSINTSTGVITGTPGAIGTFLITITATNVGGFDEQTLILTVTNPGPEINVRGATGGTNNIINGNIIPNAFNNTLFASIAVGANQDKDYRIENLGVSNLTLTGVPIVQISGTHAADFTVLTPPTSPIVSGANSVFVIRFSPLAGGVRNATVTIVNNDSDEAPYTFAIQGGGLAPDITIVGNGNQVLSGSTTPDLNNHTNFGNTNVTAATKLRNFFIINLGGDILDITGVTITGTHAADFTVTGVPSATVGLNNSTTLGITFDPSALGLREALVTITNNVPGKSPYTFAISGVGIDFDECVIGGSSIFKTQTFEGAIGTNVLGYTVATALGANPPIVTGGTAFGGSRTLVSNKFLNNNSLQVTGPYPSTFDPKAKVIVTFDVVDTSIYQDVSFNVNIGAYSTNGTQGLDVSDWVTIFISGDGGLTWSREAIVKGNSNAIWNVFGGGTTFTNPFKGLDIPYEVQPTANSVGNGTRLLTLTNLPQVTQLRVKIELDVDRNDEVWVIDNVQLRGRLPVPKTWNGIAWSGDGLPPTSVEKAIFAGNYNTTTHGNVIACECQINSPRIVTITDGNYIQSAGKVVNNGTLIVENNGSLVQQDDYAVNSGNVTVRRTANIRRLDYVYWSSPVLNFPVLNISTGTPASNVFKWLPTISGNFGNWTTANENMVRGKGYIVRGPSAYTTTIQPFNTTFTGAPNNGVITPTIERGSYTGGGYPSPTNPLITVTANDDNFNLLGNPYPSAISALDFLTENTNIEGSVRIWTHGLLPSLAFNDPFYNNFAYNYSPNDYIVHNGTGTVSGPSGFNGFIASGQGFFVLMNDGPATAETVTFRNSMRNSAHANNQFFRTSDALNGEEDFKIWLDFIPQDGNPVRTLVGYVDGATTGKDRLFDASTKVDGSSKMYSLIDAKPFIIQGRPLPFDENDSVPMGYNTTAPGTFTVAVANILGLGNKKVYLEDKLLGLSHDLTVSPYVFESSAGVFNDRFVLRYTNTTLGATDFEAAANDVIAFGSNGLISIHSKQETITSVTVLDILGKVVLRKDNVSSNDIQFANPTQANQAFVLKITLANGMTVTKKVVL